MEVMTTLNPETRRWNDDRLDEFAANVDKRFDKVDARFDKVDEQFARVNKRLDDLIQILFAGVIALTGAILAGFAAMITLFATHF